MTSLGERGVRGERLIIRSARNVSPLFFSVASVSTLGSAKFIFKYIQSEASRKLIFSAIQGHIMNVQRKRIAQLRITSVSTALATVIVSIDFDDGQAVNVHGLNVSMGASPNGPDETFVGRWYVVNLPPSIVSDSSLLSDWIANLNTLTGANTALDTAEFVWGAGTIMCAEQSTFQHTFNPSTSRNMKHGSRLSLIMVADAISGVVDDWDGSGVISLFTS